MAVRPADAGEAGGLVDCYEWLLAPPGSRPPTWDREHAKTALADAISSDRSTVLVAEEETGGEGGEVARSRVVGICAAYLDLDSVRYGQRCWVEDLAVAPDRRSRGVGAALLDAAAGWARGRGATHLELDSGLARTDAHRFYERRDPDIKGYIYTWAL